MKDEATRWCLAIEVDRSLSHQRVIAVLTRLLVLYGHPRYVRSANGPELMAQPLLTFVKDQGIMPSRIAPGKPWQNGSNESLNGTFRRECLDAERFHSLVEARVVIEQWRQHSNHERPHSALGYQTPATAFWGPSSSKSVAGGLSTPESGKRSHIFGYRARIADRSDAEVESVDVSSNGVEDKNHSENLTC